MASTTLRRFAPARPRASRPQRTVETLRDLHTALVNERQQLRSGGAAVEDLERNRLAIVHCQWELSSALIERHLPPATAPSAA
jgi:hypothetical protein